MCCYNLLCYSDYINAAVVEPFTYIREVLYPSNRAPLHPSTVFCLLQSGTSIRPSRPWTEARHTSAPVAHAATTTSATCSVTWDWSVGLDHAISVATVWSVSSIATTYVITSAPTSGRMRFCTTIEVFVIFGSGFFLALRGMTFDLVMGQDSTKWIPCWWIMLNFSKLFE